MSLININNSEYSDNIKFAEDSSKVFNTDIGALNTFSIIPNGDRFIEYKPKIMFEDNDFHQTFLEFDTFDSTTRKWTFSKVNDVKNIRKVYIYGGAYNYVIPDVSGLENCNLTNNSPNYFCLPSSFYTPYNTFIISALDGYTFPNPPTLEIIEDTDVTSYDFVLQDNLYIINAQFNHSSVTSVKIKGVAVGTTALLSDYGLIRVYKTDKTINKSLVTHRFNNNEDLGQYIYSFVRFPFSIDTKDDANIYLGIVDTQIKAPLITKQIHKLSLGKKKITGLYGDSRDIDNIDIFCLLPFYGLHNINSLYVNTEIEIIYIVDILSNTASIELYSDDVLIDSIDCYIGYSIPYIIQQGYITHNITLQNNITKRFDPKIIIKQHKQIDNCIYTTYKNCLINDVSDGFIKCENIKLKIKPQMSLYEQQLIENNLTNGIYI